eukprot:141912-Chlamydomonas_euryale.AAC.3
MAFTTAMCSACPRSFPCCYKQWGQVLFMAEGCLMSVAFPMGRPHERKYSSMRRASISAAYEQARGSKGTHQQRLIPGYVGSPNSSSCPTTGQLVSMNAQQVQPEGTACGRPRPPPYRLLHPGRCCCVWVANPTALCG